MRRLLLALLLSVPTTITVGAAAGSNVANALPSGFTDSLVADFGGLTAVEQLPDGRVVVLERGSGRVRLLDVATGQKASGSALDLNVCSNSERGLLGFTHDPGFGVNGRVYIYYTLPKLGAPNGCVNRVSAFVMIGDTINPGSEQVLIDNISSVGGNHNGGDVEIGNDGFLYIAVGDAGRDPRGDSGSAGSNDAAQDVSLLNGKILRVDRFTGSAAPGNPFSAPGTAACRVRGNTSATPRSSCQEIFAFGLRNPYRFAFDPNTSVTRFFINDVGQGRQEEVDEGRVGGNYGWPFREGNCPQGQVAPCAGPTNGLIDPVTSYSRGQGQFITGGAFIPNGAWPAEYDGGYLFADGGSGRMWLRSSDGSVDYGSPFATGANGLADMAFVLEPTGWALYYTVSFNGQLRKITYSTPAATRSVPLRYDPLATPSREFDSRLGASPAPIRGGTTRLIDISAPPGARAALVNVTLRNPAGDSFSAAWQPRTQRPTSSNVNALSGESVANSSIFPLDDNGRLLLSVAATSHVIVDVSGFFTDGVGPNRSGRFISLEPTRIVDTRDPVDDSNDYERSEIDADTGQLKFPVSGRAGIPDEVSAVAFIATAINQNRTTGGFASFAPGGTKPGASSLNTNPGFDQRANLVVIPVGADGSVDAVLENFDHLLIDVAGYFTAPTAELSTAGLFTLLPPTREVDTRLSQGFGTLGERSTVSLDPASVPANASAVAQNLTLARSGAGTFVTAYPGPSLPEASNLNATAAGQLRAALAFTKLDSGSEQIFTEGPTDLLVDIQGYFD